MNNIIIRTALKSEAEEIIRIQFGYYKEEASKYNKEALPPMQQTVEDLQVLMDSAVVLVAVIDGSIVGTIRGEVIGEEVHVGRLIVNTDQQGKGVGTALFEELEKVYSDYTEFSCMTGDKSVEMIGIYTKLGYAEIGQEEIDSELTIVSFHKKTS